MTRETEITDDRTDHSNQHDDSVASDAGRASPSDFNVSTDGDTGQNTPAGSMPGSADDSVPPEQAAGVAADPEGVLTPSDLERVTERVRELDDDRVLVPVDRGDATTDSVGDGPWGDPERDRAGTDTRAGGRNGDLTTESEACGLKGSSSEAKTAYAVDIAVKTDHGVAGNTFRSNDIRTVFEELLRWYAARVDPDVDPGVVLKVLLSDSDLDLDTW